MMAAKTPVMITFDSPTAVGQHGPLRAHPRPNLLNQMQRRAKQNTRSFFREMRRRPPTPPCSVHPQYTGERAPRSKAKGCTCRAVYEARKATS